MAAACCVLHTSTCDAATRLEAIKAIEKTILSLIDWPDDLKEPSRESRLAGLGRDSAWLEKQRLGWWRA